MKVRGGGAGNVTSHQTHDSECINPNIAHALIVVESEIPLHWQDGTWFLSKQCRHRDGMTTHMGLAWVKNRDSFPNKNKSKPKQVQNKCSFTFWFFFFFLVVVVDTGFPYFVIMVVQKLSAFFMATSDSQSLTCLYLLRNGIKGLFCHAWIHSQILSFNTVITRW